MPHEPLLSISRVAALVSPDRRKVTRRRDASLSVRRIVLLVLALVLAHVVSGESSSIPRQSNTNGSTNANHADAPDPCLVKGGQTGIEGKYSAIDEFLSERDPQKSSLARFHIHGWRWHTASLVRESGRLCTLAQRAKLAEEGDDSETMAKALQQAADYVVGFNMKGLHRIEADLMFPWMREKLTSIKDLAGEVSREFSGVMSQLESDRKSLVELGDSIIKSVAVATDTKSNHGRRNEAFQDVIEKSASMQSYAKNMMDVENNLLVPAIAKIVPESEQHSFNNKVLRNLGLLDSRLHLVAMYEAIEESGNAEEKALFEQAIPSIPQMMIPRWKRKLYEPKAGVLDTEL